MILIQLMTQATPETIILIQLMTQATAETLIPIQLMTQAASENTDSDSTHESSGFRKH